MYRLSLNIGILGALVLAFALLFANGTSVWAQEAPAERHGHDHTHSHPAPSPSASPSPTPSPTPAERKPQKSESGEAAMGTDQHTTHEHGGDTHGGSTTKRSQVEEDSSLEAGGEAVTDHSGHNMGADENKGGTTHTNMQMRSGRGVGEFMSMSQVGSGTAWQPASSPLYMWHKRVGDWNLMFHFEAKIGVNSQGGPRGVTKFESQNWFMTMATRRVGPGTLTLRGMFSLEPFTYSGAGSPQIFQTGEVYKGKSIIDAQHPHDLVMELAAQYEVPVGERGSFFAYFGWPGEPALGPVAFMHRASASENPSAPLSHHLQDATHITNGVLTTGFAYRWFKFEASIFNGREPDERRYGLEAGQWNSRSARVTFAPNRNWAIQFSHGLLKNPELLHKGDTQRTTASIQYNRPFDRGNWAASLIWGRNREEHQDSGEVFRLNSYTVESTLNFLDRNYLYTRLELVDKKDLLRAEDIQKLGLPAGFHHPQFRIGAFTLGAARDIWNTDRLSLAVGGDVTFYSKPQQLDAIYGSNPTSYKFFFRIRPARAKANHSGHGD